MGLEQISSLLTVYLKGFLNTIQQGWVFFLIPVKDIL